MSIQALSRCLTSPLDFVRRRLRYHHRHGSCRRLRFRRKATGGTAGSRNEAARLLGAALGYVWDGDAERRAWKRREDGTLLQRERWIVRRRQPAARFVLIGLYSARREETIRRTQWVATTTHPWMNLDGMVYLGRGAAEVRTNKGGGRQRKSPHGSGTKRDCAFLGRCLHVLPSSTRARGRIGCT
jgi:hypothetical protein